MKYFLRDDLEHKEIPSKPQEKDPYHHHIWDFAYSYWYLTYILKILTKLFFFVEKLWLKNTLPSMLLFYSSIRSNSIIPKTPLPLSQHPQPYFQPLVIYI